MEKWDSSQEILSRENGLPLPVERPDHLSVGSTGLLQVDDPAWVLRMFIIRASPKTETHTSIPFAAQSAILCSCLCLNFLDSQYSAVLFILYIHILRFTNGVLIGFL